jgi:plastocyanin
LRTQSPIQEAIIIMRLKGVMLLALAVAALVAAVSAVAAPARESATTTVTVRMSEFKFVLSKKSVKPGTTVNFKVTNKGAIAHDFKIAGKATKHLNAGQSQTLKVTFKKAGKFPYLCTLPSHAPAGMKGTFTVK